MYVCMSLSIYLSDKIWMIMTTVFCRAALNMIRLLYSNIDNVIDLNWINIELNCAIYGTIVFCKSALLQNRNKGDLFKLIFGKILKLKFILKWIILNKYGVQIMKDALRIFETQFQGKCILQGGDFFEFVRWTIMGCNWPSKNT